MDRVLFTTEPPPAPAIASCPAPISGRLRPVKAPPTEEASSLTEATSTLLLFRIPSAISFIKSGIYSSASESGPSFGIENPTMSLTAFARLLAALVTRHALLLMPLAISIQISAPQLYAELDMPPRMELQLLAIAVHALETLVFIVFRALVILVLAVAIFVLTVFATAVSPSLKLVLIAVIALVTAVLISVSAVVIVVLIVAQLVVVFDTTAVQVLAMVFLITPIAVSTEVRILVKAVVIVFLMLFQLVVVLEFTAVHALAIVFLMTPVAVVTVVRIAVQVVLMVCCICFHMEEVLFPVPVQAVLITFVIADPTWLIPLCIWESFCVTT